MNEGLTLRERYDAEFEKAKALISEYAEKPEKALKETIRETLKRVESLYDEMGAATTVDEFKSALSGVEVPEDAASEGVEVKARTLGEHAVKTLGDAFRRQADGQHLEVSAPEFSTKDAGDAHKRPDGLVEGWGTEYQRSIVNARRERLVVADLMGEATVTSTTIKYLVEKANRVAEGAAASVAEAGKKPYIKFTDFDIVAESLTKIAALTKLTDEMISDFGFVAEWINKELIYELSVLEEKQLLNGDGSGSNVRGLLQRSGIQTVASAKKDAWFDDIFKAAQLIPQASNFEADAIVINPADYQVLRLMKDGNGQYLAGGPFQGQYGAGGFVIEPPVWGLRTVVSNATAKGTALVGAFRQGATILRKGGLRVDSANTNADDFEHNLVTLRAEERLGLMVPVPSAFVKVTLAEG